MAIGDFWRAQDLKVLFDLLDDTGDGEISVPRYIRKEGVISKLNRFSNPAKKRWPIKMGQVYFCLWVV